MNRLTEITAARGAAGQITLDGTDIHNLEVNALRRGCRWSSSSPTLPDVDLRQHRVFARRAAPKHGYANARKRPATRNGGRGRAAPRRPLGRGRRRPRAVRARLPGGQQQRLCIARSLAAEPEVLLLDEPCSALDPISTAIIEELIVQLRESVAIVIVTHNLQQAFRVGDEVAFMHLGELGRVRLSRAGFDHPREERTREYVSGAFG